MLKQYLPCSFPSIAVCVCGNSISHASPMMLQAVFNFMEAVAAVADIECVC